MPRTATPRPLRRLRRVLALLAAVTTLAIAAACRLGPPGRLLAGACAVAGLVAWLALLELEGRASERLDAHPRRRAGGRRVVDASARHRPLHRVQAAPKPQKQTARSGDRAV